MCPVPASDAGSPFTGRWHLGFLMVTGKYVLATMRILKTSSVSAVAGGILRVWFSLWVP